MKKITYIICFAALAATMSCSDLDLESKGIIDESVLMSSDAGVATYFVKLYNELPIEDFLYAGGGPECGYGTCNAKGKHTGNVWETNKYWSGQFCRECFSSHMDGVASSEAFGYWPYDDIREVNNFLEKFPDYKDKFTEDVYEGYIAEARFLRAFFYFGLVKRYGGVPILTGVQDPTAPIEELEVPRNTEYDCWKFIHDDLAFAMEHLSSDKTQVYRANRYAAAALMAKTMLYAASVANYNHAVGIVGEASSQGLMGMSQTYAKEFYRYAYDACKMIQEAGYTLHQGADKTQAYREIFIENLAGEEDIFTKAYDPAENVAHFKTGLTHHWDARVLPAGKGLSAQIGTAMNPYWDLIDLYEHPSIVDASGKPVRFDSLDDFWQSEEMEPRCRANFLFPGMAEVASGTVLDLLAGVYSTFPGTAADACPSPNVENDYTAKYRKIETAVGLSRKIGARADGTIVEGYADDDPSVVKKYGLVKISGDHGCLRSSAEFSASYATVIYKHIDYSCDPQTRT
nr:RagB/SusD family nutrient uptake outer membrane protein [Bacteroidales bacterium]